MEDQTGLIMKDKEMKSENIQDTKQSLAQIEFQFATCARVYYTHERARKQLNGAAGTRGSKFLKEEALQAQLAIECEVKDWISSYGVLFLTSSDPLVRDFAAEIIKKDKDVQNL